MTVDVESDRSTSSLMRSSSSRTWTCCPSRTCVRAPLATITHSEEAHQVPTCFARRDLMCFVPAARLPNMSFRWDWLSPVVTVPYVPALGPVRPGTPVR